MAEITRQLIGKTVLVTGGSGLIGSALIELLLKTPNIHVVGAGRNAYKFNRFSQCSSFEFLQYDATGEFVPNCNVDLVVHAASAASPNLYLSNPVETMLSNINGINEILKYGVVHKCKVVYVSSSEVYGKVTPREQGLREDDCGGVDLLIPRSSYAMGKRAAEALCASYASEFRVDVSIARPGHIYGPTASKSDLRVSSLWPRQAANGQDIVLKSAGTQVRSYTHAYDCATAIVAIALRGKPGEAYNVANPSVACSIRQLAEEIASIGGVRLIRDIPTVAEMTAFNPMDNSRLDATKLVDLGWEPVYDIHMGLTQTIQTLKQKYESIGYV